MASESDRKPSGEQFFRTRINGNVKRDLEFFTKRLDQTVKPVSARTKFFVRSPDYRFVIPAFIGRLRSYLKRPVLAERRSELVGGDDALFRAVIFGRARRIQPNGQPGKGIITVEPSAVRRLDYFENPPRIFEQSKIDGQLECLTFHALGKALKKSLARRRYRARGVVFRGKIERNDFVE